MTIKRKINISILVFVVFVLIFLFFAIFPLFLEIKNNSKELLLQKKLTADNDVQKKNLEQFKVFSTLFGENFKRIENLFVDPDVPVEFIQFLENTAASSNLRVKIAPLSQSPSDKDKWPFLSFQIVTNGFFPDSLKFLEKIENSFYLVKIQNLNISIDGVDSDKIEASFSIKVFSRP